MIAFDRVEKRFGGRTVVGPLTFGIAEGQFVALLGGSGSGKTTTLKMINGLVTPEAGEVRVEGEVVGAGPLAPLRRRIGYVFQEIGLLPHMTVAENIALGPRLAGWDRARIAARTAELLELTALPAEVGPRLPAALSGGQRQRVGVARALAAGPAPYADGRAFRGARSDHPRCAGARLPRPARSSGPHHRDGDA